MSKTIDDLFTGPEKKRAIDPETGKAKMMQLYHCKECGNYTTKAYREDHYTIHHSNIGFDEIIPNDRHSPETMRPKYDKQTEAH